jgi:hypothetical protein
MQTMLLSLALVIGASGCSSIKEFVPISSHAAMMRIPNQQRILSEAALGAVAQTVTNQELNLAQLQNRTVVVEMDGVFPHSHEELLTYLRTAVEGELARRGIHVIHALPPELQVPEGGNAGRFAFAIPGAAEALHADARLVVSVDWGGVDYQDHKHASSSRVAGMVVTGIFTFGLGAIIWALASTPMVHTLTLKARVHLTARTIPLGNGLRFAQASGAGESQITIDAETDSGYTNNMSVPQKKE